QTLFFSDVVKALVVVRWELLSASSVFTRKGLFTAGLCLVLGSSIAILSGALVFVDGSVDLGVLRSCVRRLVLKTGDGSPPSLWLCSSLKRVLRVVLLRFVTIAVLPFGLPNGSAAVYLSSLLLLVGVVTDPYG
ncbi:hypothetical protein A2U01_0034626, partial [Trifolium medium]|nr:hypothetical protein [Trifolium medium]